MRRSLWLAVGAAAAAAGLPALATLDPGFRIAVAVVAAATAAGLAAAPRTWLPPAGALLAGATLVALRLALVQATAPPVAGPLPAAAGPWQAEVESVSAPRDGSQPAVVRLVTPEGVLRVAATLPAYPVVRPSDRVAIDGPLRRPPDDEYGRYLDRIGVEATLRASRVVRTAPGGDPVAGLRATAGDALAAALPEPEAGLAAGILIGLRERVDRGLAAAFTASGVSHVVAISGWNIAIVAGAVGALAGRSARRRRSTLILGAVAGYVVLSGASASVVRAGLMAGVTLLARESGRAGAASVALGWAATLLLVADPGMVADAGFGLSTLATAGLLAWATPATRLLERARLPHFLAESLGVSLAAQAATLPLVLVDFGRLALVAPLVNLLVVPLVVPAMAGGTLALGAGLLGMAGLPPPLPGLLALPGWLPLHLLTAIVTASAGLPGAGVVLDPALGAPLAAACTLVLAIAGTRPGRRLARTPLAAWRRAAGRAPRGHVLMRAGIAADRTPRRFRVGWPERVAALLAAASMAALLVAFSSRTDGSVRITALDVGQGDAILLEGDRGHRLLIDGGPDPARLLAALDARLPPWDRRLDGIVLTHPHEDHVAGLPELLTRYQVGALYEPGMRGPGPGYAAFRTGLALSGRTTQRLSTGDRLALDDVTLRVLWPDRDAVPSEPPDAGTGINNVSIVFLGTFGSERFLLAGDIEQQIDPVLLARSVPRVEVLKVAHHGSATASTEAFLDAARPRIALVSAGLGNPYGHPAPSTIERLLDHGAEVLRTDRNGSVTVTLDGRRASAVAQRGEPQRPATARTTATPARFGAASDGLRQAPAAPRRAGAAFTCAIPLARASAAATAVARAGAVAAQRSTPAGGATGGAAGRLRYHPLDDGPWASGRRGDPAGLPAADLVRAPLAGGGRGGGLARRRGRAARRPVAGPARPAGRGGGRTAPRHRQGPAP